MKKSTKAVLLSALVFPGTGHLFLKKYLFGTLLIGSVLIAFYFLVTRAIEQAQHIVELIQSGEVQPDIASVTELITKSPTGSEGQLLNIATAALVIAWLVGIFDSYRVGRTQDLDSNS
jgi:hypothetical protein